MHVNNLYNELHKLNTHDDLAWLIMFCNFSAAVYAKRTTLYVWTAQ